MFRPGSGPGSPTHRRQVAVIYGEAGNGRTSLCARVAAADAERPPGPATTRRVDRHSGRLRGVIWASRGALSVAAATVASAGNTRPLDDLKESAT
jgi:hypothetical protein